MVELVEFASIVPNFDRLSDREKVRHFAWYLHHYRKMDAFVTGDVRRCFEELRLVPPNVSAHLIRMAQAKPPTLIRVRDRYKLHRQDMTGLDSMYGTHPTTLVVSKLLASLPGKIPDLAERVFLEEAISCYRVEAYRAAIVMTWNLTYDHLIRWLTLEPARLMAINAALARRFQKTPPTVTALQDFEGIKEFDVVEVCGTSGLVSSNVVRILKEKLARRNMAAHPSAVTVTEAQANDVITDLVNNVVLTLR